ncbi:MAG: TatD family hydrolase, partial [Clostridia bacterium]|nr:TatD family hydrolase [Clostridia bacterium]
MIIRKSGCQMTAAFRRTGNGEGKMKLFDSHCHVNEEKFDGDREEVLARMAEHGITRYAVIGS